MSIDVSYNRRSWSNFFTTNNAALTPADWDQVTLTAPKNPLLPGGGGYPVQFLVRNARQAVGVSDSYYTTDADFGDETHYWQGVDATFNARLGKGVFFQGGTSTGRGVNDTCQIEIARFGKPMVIVDGQPTCAFTEPWLTQVRGLGSYTVPKVDVQFSAIFRSQPNAQPATTSVATNGGSRNATYQMTPAQFLAATGVPLRAGLAQQAVNIVAPGALYGDRIMVLDLRLAKVLRFGKKRMNIGVDLYNLFNSNTATVYNEVFDVATVGAKWMQPTAVLTARATRFNAQFDF